MRLAGEFYIKDGIGLAKDLLGKVLVKRQGDHILKGRIVETEAYLGPEDRASHAWNGKKTKRTRIMYKSGGTTYVYLIYGMYHCFNVVAYVKGIPHAVLIRAVEPIEGIEIMRENRKRCEGYSLSNGPGKLCGALGITKKEDDRDLTTDCDIWIEDDGYLPERISQSRRIGVDYAMEYKEKLWRYYIEGNPWVSKLKREEKNDKSF